MKQKRLIIVFAKEPLPGRVKTRLAAAIGSDNAVVLYRDWAREAYRTASGIEGASAQVAYDAASKQASPDWMSASSGPVPFFPQEGDDLGERMKRAFEKAFAEGFDEIVLIGTDSPGLPPEHLRKAFQALDSNDLVLGPTEDGGYYLIGLSKKIPAGLFEDVEWSTGQVLNKTRGNAEKRGLKTRLLPEYFDIDLPEDLARINKKISVILPVLNEAGLIEKRVRSLRGQARGFKLEIIIVDGGSADGTLEKARSLADHAVDFGRPSRGGQMHAGALKASGDILFFLHADTEPPPDWVRDLQSAFFGNGSVPVAAAFDLGFDSDDARMKIIAVLARWRNRLTGVPQGDQGLAVERKAYFESGGFPDAPLMEEYILIPRLRKLGKVDILGRAVRTSARKYEKNGPFMNALLNLKTLLLFYAGVPAEDLARSYRAR